MWDPWRHEGASQDEAPRARPRVRGTTWLLLALLVAVAWPYLPTTTPPPPTHYLQVADGPPPPVAPSGALLEVFDAARPATLRIEVRCAGVFGRQVLGLGSGFFFDPEGLVLTAYHVVDAAGASASCREVRFVGVTSERREYALELVGFDAYMDLAVMRAEVAEPVPFIPLARSLPNPGAEVVAIGNSRNDFLQGRVGKVTRLGVRASRVEFAESTIELTAALAPGDSGGPVITARGEAVGVVSYISFRPMAMESTGYVPPFLLGVALPRDFASYAVPVEVGSALVSGLVAGGRRDVPVIGFTWQQGYDYQPGQGPHDLGPRPGPIVVRVTPGGPADTAGLRSFEVVPRFDDQRRAIGNDVVADVIVAVDGVATPTFADLLAQIRRKQIGQTVAVSVQRGGVTLRVPLELGARRSVFAGGQP
jgi:serine protease Do